MLAARLLRGGFPGSLTVIESREQLGAGLAYSTSFPGHLLNVPAATMSAVAEKPAHFLEWLRERHFPAAEADCFAPRKLYREYLDEVLRQSLSAGAGRHFTHLRAEAIEAHSQPSGARLTLSNGTAVHAGRVVLALGNPAVCPDPGPVRDGLEDCWHLSPWLPDALRVRFPGERILLLGSGLTAVDAALALHGQELACEVTMLSRRGVLPQVHNLAAPSAAAPILRSRTNLRLLFRELRAAVHSEREAGGCWRGVVNALRPHSNELWTSLPLKEKHRFLRHLKTYWEAHRHRMAPAVRADLDRYRANGALRILAGRVHRARPRDGAAEVGIRLRTGEEREFSVNRIISCTGIHESYQDSSRPLIRSLVGNRLAFPNDLGLGFRTDPQGALLDGDRKPSAVFFTLGPTRQGELFECTAVPEIRAQAEGLAVRLASSAPSSPLSLAT